jgi:hypothetical protein
MRPQERNEDEASWLLPCALHLARALRAYTSSHGESGVKCSRGFLLSSTPGARPGVPHPSLDRDQDRPPTTYLYAAVLVERH